MEADLIDSFKWNPVPDAMSQPGANQMHPEDLQVPGTTQDGLFPDSFIQLGLVLPRRKLRSRLVLKGPSSSWTTEGKEAAWSHSLRPGHRLPAHVLFPPCPSCAWPVPLPYARLAEAIQFDK